VKVGDDAGDSDATGRTAPRTITTDDLRIDAGLRVNADLSLTKTVSPSSGVVPVVATYSVKLTNSGLGPATGVVVTDVVPAGAKLVAGSVAVSQGTASTAPSAITWTVGGVAASTTPTLSYQLNHAAPGTFTNRAQVTAVTTPDPDSGPNPCHDGVQRAAVARRLRNQRGLRGAQDRHGGRHGMARHERQRPAGGKRADSTRRHRRRPGAATPARLLRAGVEGDDVRQAQGPLCDRGWTWRATGCSASRPRPPSAASRSARASAPTVSPAPTWAAMSRPGMTKAFAGVRILLQGGWPRLPPRSRRPGRPG
jgi:uncharacterized repeat protein (TIGR01451 family)